MADPLPTCTQPLAGHTAITSLGLSASDRWPPQARCGSVHSYAGRRLPQPGRLTLLATASQCQSSICVCFKCRSGHTALCPQHPLSCCLYPRAAQNGHLPLMMEADVLGDAWQISPPLHDSRWLPSRGQGAGPFLPCLSRCCSSVVAPFSVVSIFNIRTLDSTGLHADTAGQSAKTWGSNPKKMSHRPWPTIPSYPGATDVAVRSYQVQGSEKGETQTWGLRISSEIRASYS